MRIFIDAGHNDSNFNTGALANGMREQDITFEVALHLSQALNQAGLQTMLSRPTRNTNLGTDGNSSINARWQMSNNWGADFFISIHANAGGGTGAEAFFHDRHAEALSQTLLERFTRDMGLRLRRNELRSELGVIRHTKAPAVLFELAFMDSPLTNPDVAMLRNKRQEMAISLANGFFEYLNINPNQTPQSPQSPQAPSTPEHSPSPPRFNTLDQIPTWARPTIQKLINNNHLQGDGQGLDLSLDMIRLLVILDRAGNF